MITKLPMPENAFLAKYEQMQGAYTDCYAADVDRCVRLEEFIEAFYTTPVFKLERLVLSVIGRGSSDRDAAQLAGARAEQFAAWTVEQRTDDQILMCDFAGRTRSWLMVVSTENDGERKTKIFFGSAVVPGKSSNPDKPSLGVAFTLMLGFHQLYSRILLAAAAGKLRR